MTLDQALALVFSDHLSKYQGRLLGDQKPANKPIYAKHLEDFTPKVKNLVLMAQTVMKRMHLDLTFICD